MPRPVKNTPRDEPKSTQELAEEQAGMDVLHHYCRNKSGRAAQLARATGILPAVISRMSNYRTPISCEAALLMHVATDGELRAQDLCPSRADL